MSYYFFFFFNDTATTEIYTLSLHDALPISRETGGGRPAEHPGSRRPVRRKCGLASDQRPKKPMHTPSGKLGLVDPSTPWQSAAGSADCMMQQAHGSPLQAKLPGPITALTFVGQV